MQKILVIDDEELFRHATACALQRKGFEIFEAPDGAAGADLARRMLPDLIVCDIHMENMDGYALLEALRQQPATATIPFILMTGMDDRESMRRGMNLGADDYLQKPFTAAQLFSAVDARLKKHLVLRQDAEKRLSELRANLSLALPHEMITPLNGIFGLAELLATGAESLTPAEVSDFGQNILKAAERLHRTVQNFLLYGQLEIYAGDAKSVAALRGKTTWQVGPLVSARARFLAEHASRSADLVLDVADGAIAASQNLFTKLVDELIDNALKFSRAGDSVRVAGALVDSGYRLTVSDRGRGMDASQIAAIGAYAQFNRKTQEQQGSGLGLTIARRIVHLHGGKFEIQSEPGQGTTVTAKLPLALGEGE